MKKLLTSALLFCLTFNVFAQEKIISMWPFTPASNQGNYFRAILEQANKDQNKYEFLFENKTGGGGAIATTDILNRSGTRILAHSAAFFARPYLYPNTLYKFDQFKPLMIMGFAPAALISKGKTLDQILTQKRINIATAGAGSSTHLLAESFFKQYKEGRDIVMVHYRDSNEAAKDVIGGQADASFEFLGDAKARGNLISIIGITGTNKIENFQLLKGMEELVGIFAIYVPKDMPTSKVNELQTILLKAEKTSTVQSLYKRDFNYKDPSMSIPSDLTEWYNKTVTQFEGFTKDIKVN